MQFKFPIELESEARKLWHRITGTVILVASSVLTLIALQWLAAA